MMSGSRGVSQRKRETEGKMGVPLPGEAGTGGGEPEKAGEGALARPYGQVLVALLIQNDEEDGLGEQRRSRPAQWQ